MFASYRELLLARRAEPEVSPEELPRVFWEVNHKGSMLLSFFERKTAEHAFLCKGADLVWRDRKDPRSFEFGAVFALIVNPKVSPMPLGGNHKSMACVSVSGSASLDANVNCSKG